MKFWKRLKSDFTYIKGLTAISATSRNLSATGDLTIADDLEPRFEKAGNAPAILFEDQEVSYSQLEMRANAFANWALAAGLVKGDCVALFLQNCPDYVAFWVGMSKIGVKTALINTNLSGKGLAHCIEAAGARIIVLGRRLAYALDTARAELSETIQAWTLGGSAPGMLDLDAILAGMDIARPDKKYRAGVKSGETALYIYTSGTTGLPKAARITHLRAIGFMRTFVPSCSVTSKDRIMITLPLYHATGGLCAVGCALQTGGSILLKEKFSASRFWTDAKEGNATMFVYIGEFGRYLMACPPSDAERNHGMVKAFGNGLRADVWKTLVERTGIENIVEFYGSTEGNVSMINLDSTIGSIGRVPPLLKNRMQVRLIKIDPDTLEPLRGSDGFCIEAEAGEPGEAIGRISDTDPRRRYDGYKDDEQSQKKILRDAFDLDDAWFRTGDLLRRDELDYFYFVDRLGDTFRWKGENVSTNEVAEAISKFEGIELANVYGVEAPGREGRAGMAALQTSGPVDFKLFHAFLQSALPSYARPVFLRVQKSAETTGTFKLKKMDLVKAGFDPAQVNNDPLFIIDHRNKSYEPVTEDIHEKILAGEWRL